MWDFQIKNFEENDVRFIVRADTVDFVIYINWLAQTIREKKVRNSRGLDSWVRDGNPIPISVTFRVKPGVLPDAQNPIGPRVSSNEGEPGYRQVGEFLIGATVGFPEGGRPSVDTPASVVAAINSMKVLFTHNGTSHELNITSNLLTKYVTTGLIFLLIIVIVAIVVIVFGVTLFSS